MGKVNSMTQAEYARHRGVSEPAVSKAISRGRISLMADGKIDPVAADAQWANNTRARVATKPQTTASATASTPAIGGEPAGENDYWHARTRRERAEALRAEMAADEDAGDLIRVAAVRSVFANALSAARDALRQLPARMAPVLAAETDPAKVHDQLQAELDQWLAQLAGTAERIAPRMHP